MDIIGNIYKQNCGDYLKVLNKTDKKSSNISLYECEFQKYPYKILAQKSHIIRGEIINYNIPDKYGFYLGEKHVNNKEIYKLWLRIKFRCYSEKCISYPRYGNKGIIVCEEWKCYTNFENWYLNNEYFGFKLQLDKDILFNVNHLEQKIYSPNTCLLIPEELNYFLAGDNFSSGVFLTKSKRYGAVLNYKRRRNLGTFSSFKEAKQVYAEEKYKIWKELINKYDIKYSLKETLLKYDFSWYWLKQ